MPSQQMPSPLKKEISLSGLKLKRPEGMPSILSGGFSFKRRGRQVVVGLDIQPGYVAAARARRNGGIVVDQAAALSLPADTVREGEVLNQEALSAALRELFAQGGLDRHVRVGVANQRTVMRTLEVPPFSDQKELAAAVRFQAEDQVPMPLNNAVLDFRPLGVVDTPEGARQRVLLVAAQRDMIEKILAATKAAGLRTDGIDLSAFALIRSLYRPEQAQGQDGPARVLYLNVGGLTNMAIAEGATCRFTRVLARGLEAIAGEVAERRAVPIDQARELLRRVNLATLGGSLHDSNPGLIGDQAGGAAGAEALAVQMEQARAEGDQTTAVPDVSTGQDDETGASQGSPLSAVPDPGADAGDGGRPTLTVVGGATSDIPGGADDGSSTATEPQTGAGAVSAAQPSAAAVVDDLPDVRVVLESGVRGIAGEVRNSLDFYQAQEHGSAVSAVFLSGPALDIPGFADILQQNLGVPVHAETVGAASPDALAGISPQYLAIAAGLAIEEVGP
jgi:type IV pilus assembly protein PilM